MIRIQISKSTKKVIHVGKDDKKTVITSLPSQANFKVILARVKVMNLPTRSN